MSHSNQSKTNKRSEERFIYYDSIKPIETAIWNMEESPRIVGIKNVSRHGMCLTIDRLVEVQTFISLNIKGIDFDFRIKHCKAKPNGKFFEIGLELVHPTEEGDVIDMMNSHNLKYAGRVVNCT